MSKFDYEVFYGEGGTFLGVSKEKHTLEEAKAIAVIELGPHTLHLEDVEWVARHRAGVDDDGVPCVGWWLDAGPLPRSCPVWVFEQGGGDADARD